MSPWNILGWALVFVLILVPVFSLSFKLGREVFRTVQFRVRCRRSRRVAPESGQVWKSRDGTVVRVTAVHSNGVVGIRAGSTSWGERPESFRDARRYLAGGPRGKR